ncbi:hypothetical protein ACIRYZ_12535 [Kitasatospora sp. NPDC101155]|uniref:hypothetical protein n=1 Tax=Kitasatospora sp. NPDC101155 TaxID=3364097 RepID=UPI0038156563
MPTLALDAAALEKLVSAAVAAPRGPGYVQILIRLGYGPEGAPTPRLAVRDVLGPEV